MDDAELTKIVIAAAAGALAKEAFAALVRMAKSGAAFLVGRLSPWLSKNWTTVDWILSVAIICFIARTFLRYPEADAPVTHNSVRLLIFMALIWVSQFFAVARAADRMLAGRDQKKTPNKAPEPTPGSVTPRATEGASK